MQKYHTFLMLMRKHSENITKDCIFPRRVGTLCCKLRWNEYSTKSICFSKFRLFFRIYMGKVWYFCIDVKLRFWYLFDKKLSSFACILSEWQPYVGPHIDWLTILWYYEIFRWYFYDRLDYCGAIYAQSFSPIWCNFTQVPPSSFSDSWFTVILLDDTNHDFYLDMFPSWASID